MRTNFILSSIIGVLFLLFLTSCTSGVPIKDTQKEDEISLVGSTSQTGSDSQKGVISEDTIDRNEGSEISKDMEWPIDDGENRVTKKIFGLRVSPTDSPISREKFSGYHTGIDFEITEDESDDEIEIRAVCSGPLVYKKWVSGYGGVAIQKCILNSEEVTVLYGHLFIDSIMTSLNTEIPAGEKIGILGKGYSTETDGERKHLHLSIHKGANTDLKGYASSPSELSEWKDPMGYLK